MSLGLVFLLPVYTRESVESRGAWGKGNGVFNRANRVCNPAKRRHLAILSSQVPRSTRRSVTRGTILWGDMGSESASFALDCRGAEKRRKGETEKSPFLTVDPSPLHIYVVITLFLETRYANLGESDSRAGSSGNVSWRGTKDRSLHTVQFSIFSFCLLTLSYT